MRTFGKTCDTAYGCLRSRPGFTLTVVVTLALGNWRQRDDLHLDQAVLLDPLPGIEQPEKLVEIWAQHATTPPSRRPMSTTWITATRIRSSPV